MEKLILTRQCACVVCSAILESGQRCDCSPDKPRAHLSPAPVVLRATTGNAVLFVNNPDQKTPDADLVASVQSFLDAKRAPIGKASQALSDLAFSLNLPDIPALMDYIERLKAQAEEVKKQAENAVYHGIGYKAKAEARDNMIELLNEKRALLRRARSFQKRQEKKGA